MKGTLLLIIFECVEQNIDNNLNLLY